MPNAAGGDRSSLTDAIRMGTLTRLVPREPADEVVAPAGRKETRRNKPPARVTYGSSYLSLPGRLIS